MAFIRSKTIRGQRYLYIVQSRWDAAAGAPRQEIIRYLGRASQAKESDIPIQYRSKLGPKLIEARGAGQELAHKRLLEALLKGDARAALAESGPGLAAFIEEKLIPAMRQVGADWQQGRLGIGDEHICSNTAMSALSAAASGAPKRKRKKRVILCTPQGEQHQIGCKAIEACLAQKGYDVYNMAPDAPAESVASHAAAYMPACILVSVTLAENLRAAKRLASRAIEAGVPVIMGGPAAAPDRGLGYKAYAGSSITHIIRLIESAGPARVN